MLHVCGSSDQSLLWSIWWAEKWVFEKSQQIAQVYLTISSSIVFRSRVRSELKIKGSWKSEKVTSGGLWSLYIGITLNHLKRHSAQEDFETVASHSEKQTLKRFSGGSGRPTLILSSSQAHLNCPWCLLSVQVPGPSRNLGGRRRRRRRRSKRRRCRSRSKGWRRRRR